MCAQPEAKAASHQMSRCCDAKQGRLRGIVAAKVLAGHQFVADERGLLPHVEVTRWIARQADDLRARLARAPSEGRESAAESR